MERDCFADTFVEFFYGLALGKNILVTAAGASHIAIIVDFHLDQHVRDIRRSPRL
jgi:hypothetical protein